MHRFHDLAPSELRNFRPRRYLGDDQCLAMEALTETDAETIRWIYTTLQELFETVRHESDAEKLAGLQRFAATHDAEDFVTRVLPLGKASYAANPHPRVAKTMHDVRGGGLTPLLARLQLAQIVGPDPDTARSLFFLTRDHLKIMRNALLGLDDKRRNEDLLPKLHGTDLIVQKWDGAVIQQAGRELQIRVQCPEHVDISECCVEFGALDRILYNLLNNACRHSSGETIELVIFRIPDAQGENLRFVLQNHVTEADAAHLAGAELRNLFEEGVSTTGSGYGLAVVTDFVANAFGLTTPAAALDGQYLGARLLAQEFAVWFHWPIVAD
jgi:signal transduction histidine kinase